ncbi:hypothetical protein RRF57_000041 [Xylaria bambusicola]|uniref:Uncharacterized protein n=1 Tax=Xylaria bambusicola TaxID=326684 RepID=A0AAN7U354_9PEZI
MARGIIRVRHELDSRVFHLRGLRRGARADLACLQRRFNKRFAPFLLSHPLGLAARLHTRLLRFLDDVAGNGFQGVIRRVERQSSRTCVVCFSDASDG